MYFLTFKIYTFIVPTENLKVESRVFFIYRNLVFGLGGACMGAKDGKVYFVGAIEEKDPQYEVGKVSRRWPFSMGLIAYDPNETK